MALLYANVFWEYVFNAPPMSKIQKNSMWSTLGYHLEFSVFLIPELTNVRFI